MARRHGFLANVIGEGVAEAVLFAGPAGHKHAGDAGCGMRSKAAGQPDGFHSASIPANTG